MRRLIVAVCSVALLIAVAVPAASATLPRRVTIISDMTFVDGGHSYGTFAATGGAVRHHVICPRGEVRDIYLKQVEGGWDVVKAFVCANGSKTFIVRMLVQVNPDGTERFTWAVKGGTGLYRGLYGSGRGTSTAWSDGHLTNTYTGTLIGG